MDLCGVAASLLAVSLYARTLSKELAADPCVLMAAIHRHKDIKQKEAKQKSSDSDLYGQVMVTRKIHTMESIYGCSLPQYKAMRMTSPSKRGTVG